MVPSLDNRKVYNVDEAQLPMSLDGPHVVDEADLAVYDTLGDDEQLLFRGIHYTVSQVGNVDGSRINLTSKPHPGVSRITLLRAPAPLQLLSLIPNNNLDAKALEKALDRIVMMIQNSYEQISHSVITAVTQEPGEQLVLPADRVNKIFRFNQLGSVFLQDFASFVNELRALLEAGPGSDPVDPSQWAIEAPIGSLLAYPFASAIPEDYLLCNGSPVTEEHEMLRKLLLDNDSPWGTSGINPLLPNLTNRGLVSTGPETGTVGQYVGSNTKEILKTHLPNIHLKTRMGNIPTALGNPRPAVTRDPGDPYADDGSPIEPLGDGTPFNVISSSMTVHWLMKAKVKVPVGNKNFRVRQDGTFQWKNISTNLWHDVVLVGNDVSTWGINQEGEP